jgi:hypothetical protein
MGEALILHTTFLVDLERELTRGETGPAQEFLELRPNASLRRADRDPQPSALQPGTRVEGLGVSRRVSPHLRYR